MKHQVLVFLFLVLSCPLFSQEEEKILTAQKNAIVSLSEGQGFSPVMLETYLVQKYGRSLQALSKKSAAEIIRLFQSERPPVPNDISSSPLPAPPTQRADSTIVVKTIEKVQVAVPVPSAPVPQTVAPSSQANINPPVTVKESEKKPLLAQFLHAGMSKRFHLVDGNIILGTIVKIEESICYLETPEGILKIPTDDILEETAEISKRDESKYVGPVISETIESITLRSKYGDVVIDKKEIRDMNRYHGGKLVPWAEEKKRFYRSQVSLTDIFLDPTAFPLEANAMYISGLSIGYGFTDQFMVRTAFGNNFQGDLNLRPLWQFYLDHSATQRSGIAIGFDLFSRHDMSAVLANYSRFIRNKSTKKILTDSSMLNVSLDQVINPEYTTAFYAETYIVYSKLWSLESGRGEMGYHFGFRTNTLPLVKQRILTTPFEWTNDKLNIFPFRIWGAFEYDLTKNLKFAATAWADNGYRYRTFRQVSDDYFSDSTPFTLDASGGEYRSIDFDFGFLYAINDSFRFGVHFKETYFVFFWRILEL